MDYRDAPAVVVPIPNGFVARLIGPIHTNNAWIEGEFKKIVDAKPKEVELDLAETTFLSSSGVGTLVWLYNKVTEVGGVVRITAIRKRVLSTLKFSRLEKLFQTEKATVLPD